MSIILSADIGGTTTSLALNQFESGVLTNIKKSDYKSADWQTAESLFDDFLKNTPQCQSACFAVAGPLKETGNDTQVNVTNLPWKISRRETQKKYQFQQFSIINDFQAIAYSVDQLKENETITLQKGQTKNNGTRAFIGAGTGLGQSIAIHNGVDYNVISTEGGHCDYAPSNDFEVVLYQYLNQKYKHVSYERILSGEGLYNIYQFLKQVYPVNESTTKADESIESAEDKAQSIAQQAQIDQNGLAAKTMSLFFNIYGAQAGNLALSCLPTGGIYIAGGIALKNLERLKNSEFMQTFTAKGRMTLLMQSIPVKVITAQNAGLSGATYIALKQIHSLEEIIFKP